MLPVLRRALLISQLHWVGLNYLGGGAVVIADYLAAAFPNERHAITHDSTGKPVVYDPVARPLLLDLILAASS